MPDQPLSTAPLDPAGPGASALTSSAGQPGAPDVPDYVFADGYDLRAEAGALAALDPAESPAQSLERGEKLQERLEQYRQIHSEHVQRQRAEVEVPLPQARKATAMGALRVTEEDSMTIHTLEAMRLYLGVAPGLEPGSPFGVPGGRRAATALRQLFLLSAHDNPYADWRLVQMDERLAQLRALIADTEAAHMQLIDGMRARGLTLGVLSAEHPQTVSLGYHSPYGYAISMVMVLFDHCVRVIKSAERRDLTSKADGRRAIHRMKHACRSLFEAAIVATRHLMDDPLRGLSRADYLPQADEAAANRIAAARTLLGQLPQSVFVGARSPRHTLRNERLSAVELALLHQLAHRLDAVPSDAAHVVPTAGLVD